MKIEGFIYIGYCDPGTIKVGRTTNLAEIVRTYERGCFTWTFLHVFETPDVLESEEMVLSALKIHGDWLGGEKFKNSARTLSAIPWAVKHLALRELSRRQIDAKVEIGKAFRQIRRRISDLVREKSTKSTQQMIESKAAEYARRGHIEAARDILDLKRRFTPRRRQRRKTAPIGQMVLF